ncbi:hypothetical protein TNCV_3089861 [Trichonephila clavipes]|nr:hypothetical protein TNCV_3089861 [Trichonephila clavipes]
MINVRINDVLLYDIKQSQEVFEIAGIGIYAHTTPTRHGLADMLKNTRCFTNCCSSDGYSCHQVHFKIDGCAVNRGSERSMFHQVLMHASERLMIRLPPRWISFSIQPNSNMSISVG